MITREYKGMKIYQTKENFRNGTFCFGCVKNTNRGKISCDETMELFGVKSCKDLFVESIFFLKLKRF